MTYRLLIAALLPLSAVAQIQLFQFDGTTETPVSGIYDVGTASPGDTTETRFRVRNAGSASASLANLSLAGAGFRLAAVPSLPYVIAPGAAVDFRVAFSPTIAGSYSANILVNSIAVFLRGSAVSSATVSLGQTALAAGAIIDFGKLERGGNTFQTITLANPGTTRLTVTSVTVTGTSFRGPIGPTFPITLGAGESSAFQVAFEPQNAQNFAGSLAVDKRSFKLAGVGLDPPIPKATITFDAQAGASAKQSRVSIPLASASKVSATGTLTMAFHSTLTGVTDDIAIQFLSGAKRNATVTINPGDSVAKFATQADAAFQTGTTAGDIVFTLTLPNATEQTTLKIVPVPVSFDTSSGTRRVSDLDVSLIGFDNTHSASQLSFTFYDGSGKVLQPGVMRIDVANDFNRLFSGSQLGGTFALKATFPVSGDATQVSAVDVQMANSAGVTSTRRITF